MEKTKNEIKLKLVRILKLLDDIDTLLCWNFGIDEEQTYITFHGLIYDLIDKTEYSRDFLLYLSRFIEKGKE